MATLTKNDKVNDSKGVFVVVRNDGSRLNEARGGRGAVVESVGAPAGAVVEIVEFENSPGGRSEAVAFSHHGNVQGTVMNGYDAALQLARTRAEGQ